MEATNVQPLTTNVLPLAELQTMTTRKIREKYLEAFGVPTHSNNRGYLLRRLAEKEQGSGGATLSQEAASSQAQPERWSGPEADNPEVERTIQEIIQPVELVGPARDTRLPPPGSVLSRVYKGQEHKVLVLESGFEYEGELYTSLSKIAKIIAGCCWNGFSFFLLGPRKNLQQ